MWSENNCDRLPSVITTLFINILMFFFSIYLYSALISLSLFFDIYTDMIYSKYLQ